MWYRAAMKRALLAAYLVVGALGAGALAIAAPPAPPADPPTVSSLSSLMEKELHWGMSHTDVTNAYNQLNGLFDKEYAPLLAKLQPGTQQQQQQNQRADDRRHMGFFMGKRRHRVFRRHGLVRRRACQDLLDLER